MQVPYPVLPIGLIGSGTLGDEVLRLCKETGLSIEFIQRTAKATTSQTHVMNLPGDSRTFFHHPGANQMLDETSIDIGALAERGFKLFYLGYLTLLDRLDRTWPDGRSGAANLLSEAKAQGMVTCVDLASSPSENYRKTVEATLPEIDVLFANELEAGYATGLDLGDGTDKETMLTAARRLRARGVNHAVILHAPELVVWNWGETEGAFAPPRVPPEQVESAVGAGDAFATGVMHGIHESWSPQSCIRLGTDAAAACLSGITATEGLKGLSFRVQAP